MSTQAQLTQFSKIMVLLTNPTYKLRTVRALNAQTGTSGVDEVKTILKAHALSFVVKRRRSDGAALIGLV